MAEWAVVADDLTGANTAAVLLTTGGFRTLTTIEHRNLNRFNFDEYDAVVVNASSRPMDAEDALKRVEKTTRELCARGFTRFSKRIDSTIRGNLGAEIEGMLAALDPATIACVVAVYPASGRMVVGGYQIVNGVPVHKTAAGTDPLKPVHSSLVGREIMDQTKLPLQLITLDMVLKGKEAVAAAVEREIKAGTKILVFDAISFGDIAVIAEALQGISVPWIAVDPGPFTQTACQLAHDGKPRVQVSTKQEGKVFIVAGSATDLTRSQLTYLQQQCQARFINIDIRPFLDSEEEHPLEAEAAEEVWAISKQCNIFGIRAAEHVSMLVDIKQEARERGITTDDIARRITLALARIARRTINKGVPGVKGFYLTGGDMTVACCDQFDVDAIELIEEVQPHISYGKLIGGPCDGMTVITKGGLIGDVETAQKCIKFMLDR